MRTLTLDEAAQVLKMHPEELRRRAKAGRVPAAKPGKQWVFIEELRHCWASWLAQHGTPLYVVQEMGGWKSVQMVQRYAHLSPANLVNHAKTIDAVMPNHDTFAAQSHK